MKTATAILICIILLIACTKEKAARPKYPAQMKLALTILSIFILVQLRAQYIAMDAGLSNYF